METKFKFDPAKDIDGGGFASNGERATRAAATCEHYDRIQSKAHGYDPSITANDETISDMIADLGHLCDHAGIDFEEIVESALRRWQEER